MFLFSLISPFETRAIPLFPALLLPWHRRVFDAPDINNRNVSPKALTLHKKDKSIERKSSRSIKFYVEIVNDYEF